jgi:hypothetical protein
MVKFANPEKYESFFGAELSLQKCVLDVLGYDLDKERRTTDWANEDGLNEEAIECELSSGDFRLRTSLFYGDRRRIRCAGYNGSVRRDRFRIVQGSDPGGASC